MPRGYEADQWKIKTSSKRSEDLATAATDSMLREGAMPDRAPKGATLLPEAKAAVRAGASLLALQR